jgi:peptide/nickel transport system substrate-binding protein
VTEQLYDYLAEVGADFNTIGDHGFKPCLAKSWSWSADSLQVRFEIDSAARWHDGRQVLSRDVRFTFGIYNNPAIGSSTGSQLGNIDSVTTPDSLTAVFWFRKRSPLQFFDATNQSLLDEVRGVDVEKLKPEEALGILENIRKRIV